MRNALARPNKSLRQPLVALINTIFAEETAEAASAKWRSGTDQLRAKLPKMPT